MKEKMEEGDFMEDFERMEQMSEKELIVYQESKFDTTMEAMDIICDYGFNLKSIRTDKVRMGLRLASKKEMDDAWIECKRQEDERGA